MELVKQSYEILEQEPALEGALRMIELAGRNCHRTEDRITDDSYKRFVDTLIKIGHYSCLEHGVIYLKTTSKTQEETDLYRRYRNNPYSRINYVVTGEYGKEASYFITTTLRVIIENHWEEDLKYICEPTEFHIKRHTVLLHTCIHVYKDLTRHRKASFAIESTRYCNYAGGIKFVKPNWEYLKPISDKEGESFFYILKDIEQTYNKLINYGWKPEQAAEILPQCTAADVVISAYDDDWKYIFELRSDIAKTGKPHPFVEELMTPLREEFVKNKWISYE